MLLCHPSTRAGTNSARGRSLSAQFAAALALICLSACGDGAADIRPTDAPAAVSRQAEPGSPGSAAGFNLLIVTLDTVRDDAIGCYGAADARTPVVDGLAQRGVRFAHALSPAPVTLPAHASVMTGLEPPSHGVRNNATFRLAEDRVTLAETLSDHGYATGAVVGAFVLGRCYGLAQGFQEYDDQIAAQDGHAEEGHYLERAADRVTDRAIAWLERPRSQPFFLWVHYYDAHFPYQPPAPYARTPQDASKGWDAVEHRACYLGEVSYTDEQLGRLLAKLGPETLARTLVVVTADHGEGLGEHGEFTHSVLVYGASMRVPLVFSCPTLFREPRVIDYRVAGLVDIAPTVLSLLGIESAARFDGLSLFGTTADPKRAIYGEGMVSFLDHGWAPLRSLTRLHDKFIQAPRPEYYELREDANELRNLYTASKPVARELERALAARIASEDSAGLVATRQLEPDEARKLAELGYAQGDSPPRRRGVLDPKDMIVTWALLTNARTQSKLGNFDQALKMIDDVLRFDPDDAVAWETAYVVHLNRNALPEAEACIRRVLELNPTCEAHVRLAVLLLQLGRLDESEAALNEAGKLDPMHGRVELLRGDLCIQRAQFDQARAHYARAVEIDPVRCSAGARLGREWLDAQGK